MTLFSEIYGCYYSVVARILNHAKKGIERKEIEELVSACGFSETAFHLVPKLIGGEWNFLERRGDKFFSKFDGNLSRPLTALELSWLCSLLQDARLRLFLDDKKMESLQAALHDVVPLFDPSIFLSSDRNLDGDPYHDPAYRENFRTILTACKHSEPLMISHDNGKTRRQSVYYPYKISYSAYNDKFRLLCGLYNKKTQSLKRTTLNLNRMTLVAPSPLAFRASRTMLEALFCEPNENPPLVVEVTTQRNALERFLLQFASFDRKTEFDAKRGIYTCRIFYDPCDETELLIRILGFGPTVKVLSPQGFLDQLKERIQKQLQLLYT